MKSQYANYAEEAAACREFFNNAFNNGRELESGGLIELYGDLFRSVANWFKKKPAASPPIDNLEEFKQTVDNSFRDAISADRTLEMEPFPNVLRKELSAVVDHIADSQSHTLTKDQVESAKSEILDRVFGNSLESFVAEVKQRSLNVKQRNRQKFLSRAYYILFPIAFPLKLVVLLVTLVLFTPIFLVVLTIEAFRGNVSFER